MKVICHIPTCKYTNYPYNISVFSVNTLALFSFGNDGRHEFISLRIIHMHWCSFQSNRNKEYRVFVLSDWIESVM